MTHFTTVPGTPRDAERELWQPDRHEQLAAIETLLRGPIPYEARLVLRDLDQTLRTERTPR